MVSGERDTTDYQNENYTTWRETKQNEIVCPTEERKKCKLRLVKQRTFTQGIV